MSNLPSQKKVDNEQRYYVFALKITGDFGATIAVPVVLAALIGQKLDDRHGTYPLYLAICMVISAIITAKLIYKKSKKYAKQFQNLDKN